jgi:hypothetical protein
LDKHFNPNKLKNAVQDLLEVIGAQAVGYITPLVPVGDSGNLRNSISWSVLGSQGGNKGDTTPISSPTEYDVVRIGTNVVYAAIQEFGGTIKPDKAGALTVPIHKSAKGKKASDFNDLVLIKRPGKFPLLVRFSGGKRSQRMDIMFVLVPQVTIKRQSYLRLGIYSHRHELNNLMMKGLRNIDMSGIR